MAKYQKNIPKNGVHFARLKQMISSRISGLVDIKTNEDGTKVEVEFDRDLEGNENAVLARLLTSHVEPGRETDCFMATVENLPTDAREGEVAFATDGLKNGETTGTGTGVPVYFSGGSWRVYRDDAPVQS